MGSFNSIDVSPMQCNQCLWNYGISKLYVFKGEFNRKLPVDMAYQYFDLIDRAFKGGILFVLMMMVNRYKSITVCFVEQLNRAPIG